MPIFLRDFVNTHHGVDNIDSLLEKMGRKPPNAQDTIASEFYYEKYHAAIGRADYDLPHNKILQCILEYIILNKAPGFASLTQSVTFFKQAVLPAELTMFLQAFIFDISDVGNCANRACYAALQLQQILQGTPIKIIVKSAEKVDHYVVYLGNKETGWFVYDPLTNPELVFPHEEYTKTILRMFPEAKSSRRIPMQVTVTPILYEKYQNIAKTLREELPTDVASLSEARLLTDPRIQFSIDKVGLSRSKQKAALEKVCVELKSKHSAQLASEDHAAAPGHS